MSPELPREEITQLRAAFRMPSVQTMMSRKSSITNAFVNSIIPVVEPSPSEIADALRILGMTPSDVRCSYCGDRASEWDHLRPLVVDRRPTGYISEIGNLVPSCGKCNQSKGNKNWRAWMTSAVRHAPAKRQIVDIQQRMERLEAYEKWQPIRPINFNLMVGDDLYAEYWVRLDRAMEYMRECQVFAQTLRTIIGNAHRS
jgi:hypothetical protein